MAATLVILLRLWTDLGGMSILNHFLYILNCVSNYFTKIEGTLKHST